jgi:hypothetical protein
MSNYPPVVCHKGKHYADESPLFADPGFSVCGTALEYQPRRPEESILYGVVAENLESFLAQQQERGRVVPRFVEKGLRAFLDCGILSRGFLRVHCDACGKDRVVAVIAIGPRAGSRVAAMGVQAEPEISGSKSKSGCADKSGDSLHARVCIPAKARHQLENLCRYAGRPAVATDRLSLLPDGRISGAISRAVPITTSVTLNVSLVGFFKLVVLLVIQLMLFGLIFVQFQLYFHGIRSFHLVSHFAQERKSFLSPFIFIE